VLLSLQLFGIFFASLGSAIGFFAASLSRATRDALRRQWVVLRTSYALGAASWGTQYLVLLAVGRPVSPYLALSCYCDGFGTLLFTLFFTDRVRGRIHRSLGLGWNGKPEGCRSLAAVASLIGSGAATSVIERRCRDAISSFRGVPWTSLTASDLAAEWEGELEARQQEDHTVPAALGEVDAFLSHSWSDDGREKYEALRGWADAFEAAYGRPPLLWLDRCCIRQDDDIAASLLGLPIFLSGCRSLLVLYGPSYCGRLWRPPLLSALAREEMSSLPHLLRASPRCVMEVFCFLAMGGKLDDIHVLLLPSSGGTSVGSCYSVGSTREPPREGRYPCQQEPVAPAEQLGGRERWRAVRSLFPDRREHESKSDALGKGKGEASLKRGFAKFRLSQADCSLPGDRTRMLAALESAFGDAAPFNRIVRSLLHSSSHRHVSYTNRSGRSCAEPSSNRATAQASLGGRKSLVSITAASGEGGLEMVDRAGVAENVSTVV